MSKIPNRFLDKKKPKIVCPFCQTAGRVTGVPGKRKKGISGGKATGAILTGGVSLLAVGLSKKARGLNCKCWNCDMSWFSEV